MRTTGHSLDGLVMSCRYSKNSGYFVSTGHKALLCFRHFPFNFMQFSLKCFYVFLCLYKLLMQPLCISSCLSDFDHDFSPGLPHTSNLIVTDQADSSFSFFSLMVCSKSVDFFRASMWCFTLG